MDKELTAAAGILLPRFNEVEHDLQTLNLYPKSVSNECTCGLHSPPPGLCDKPMAHIEYCAYRTNRLPEINEF